ncbi:Hypothetical predicted protein [Podarcis lilfordi]|uniref:Uncharacterized protein n=1 Tax=Podarcis lilfordi TaxID=74358 RepID=A0AA35P2R8_9SAUR|nr:Hypothetical predicted protein [Podarcis lilfordi]
MQPLPRGLICLLRELRSHPGKKEATERKRRAMAKPGQDDARNKAQKRAFSCS